MLANPVIFGCARSGTSIFGELLKEICPAYRFEPWIQDLIDNPVIEGEALKMPVSRPPRQEGLSIDLERLLAAVPNIRPMWIVRNPFDAVCSLMPQMEPKIAKSNDRHPPPMPMDEYIVDNSSPLIHAAMFWVWNNGIGYENLCRFFGYRVFVAYYEDLVADPEIFADRIQIYTGFTKNQADNWIQKVSNDKGGYEAQIQEMWSVQDHSVRSGRHFENLTDDQRRLIAGISHDTAVKFGYELYQTIPVRNF